MADDPPAKKARLVAGRFAAILTNGEAEVMSQIARFQRVRECSQVAIASSLLATAFSDPLPRQVRSA